MLFSVIVLGEFRAKFPLTSVTVPIAVFFKATVAPISASPFLSVTLPLIVVCAIT